MIKNHWSTIETDPEYLKWCQRQYDYEYECYHGSGVKSRFAEETVGQASAGSVPGQTPHPFGGNVKRCQFRPRSSSRARTNR
eukprot:4413611-Amphidinium_carterae.1